MTTGEMAELLAVSPRTVYNMVAEGQIPGAMKIGRRLRFRREDVRAWLERQAEEGRPATRDPRHEV